MNFKAICTDVDGTLLNAKRELSETTIDTFKGLPQDVWIILASSRMPSAMRHLQLEMAIEQHPLICYNGGYVLSSGLTDPIVLNSTVIPVSVCRGIVSLSKNTDIHVSLYFEEQWYAPAWDQWTERESTITKVKPQIEDPSTVFANWERDGCGAHKVMCMGSPEMIKRMEDELNRDYAQHIHVYRSRSTYLELAPLTVSKATGLTLVGEHCGFSVTDVIAFGDNYNDVALLETAGHGVAVANSRGEVIRVAKEVTVDSKEDGVARTIRKYFHG